MALANRKEAGDAEGYDVAVVGGGAPAALSGAPELFNLPYPGTSSSEGNGSVGFPRRSRGRVSSRFPAESLAGGVGSELLAGGVEEVFGGA